MTITTTPTFGFDFRRDPDEVKDLYVSFIQAGVVRFKVKKDRMLFSGTIGVFQLSEDECKNFCHANYVQIQVGVEEYSGESYVVNSVTVPVYYADYSRPDIIGFRDDEISIEYAAQILYALSPTATVTDLPDGATVTITDKAGTTSENIYDGEQGPAGPTGPQGEQGIQGETGEAAGFGTPTITITTLAPGSSATASVTASGSDTAKVFAFSLGVPQGAKGDTGATGAGMPTGGTTGQFLVKKSNTDYDFEWATIPSANGEEF